MAEYGAEGLTMCPGCSRDVDTDELEYRGCCPVCGHGDDEDTTTCPGCDEDVDTDEWEDNGGCPTCGHGVQAAPAAPAAPGHGYLFSFEADGRTVMF